MRAPNGWTAMSAEAPMATPPASVAFSICSYVKYEKCQTVWTRTYKQCVLKRSQSDSSEIFFSRELCKWNSFEIIFVDFLPWRTSCEDWGGPRYWRWQGRKLPRSSRCWGWHDVGQDRRERWQRWNWASTSRGRWCPPLKTSPTCTEIPVTTSNVFFQTIV